MWDLSPSPYIPIIIYTILSSHNQGTSQEHVKSDLRQENLAGEMCFEREAPDCSGAIPDLFWTQPIKCAL